MLRKNQKQFSKHNIRLKANSSMNQLMDKFAILYMNREKSRIFGVNNRSLDKDSFINIYPMKKMCTNLLSSWNSNHIHSILKAKSQAKLPHSESSLSVYLLIFRVGEF
eukprot:TRINITY_DN3747_c0_g2_i1.p1 TRINITY_DN3747_c0_g2~~TRINITY_DN3747_c0_g2_i1.p1  ORF type:complete len:108 (+),score=14.92 TRINITY_DN3747_c0_g2_i1:172-495(+)